jgi:hypothetical protein
MSARASTSAPKHTTYWPSTPSPTATPDPGTPTGPHRPRLTATRPAQGGPRWIQPATPAPPTGRNGQPHQIITLALLSNAARGWHTTTLALVLLPVVLVLGIANHIRVVQINTE